MTTYPSRPSIGESGGYSDRPEPTGWTGWIAFGGFMMIMLGSFHAMQGLVALFNSDYYLVHKSGLVVNADFTAWGWTHLILGVVIALAGGWLFTGAMWARIIAVIAAMVSAVVNVAFLAAYPFWSTTMIVLDVLVIWAVTVHGREMKSI
jgi:hypothetical protein